MFWIAGRGDGLGCRVRRLGGRKGIGGARTGVELIAGLVACGRIGQEAEMLCIRHSNHELFTTARLRKKHMVKRIYNDYPSTLHLLESKIKYIQQK